MFKVIEINHRCTLAWKNPWMEEPGRLQSMGSLRVRHNWITSLSLFTFMHWRRKWQPTCRENPRDSGAWWAAVYGVTQSRTWLKRLSSSSSILLETARCQQWPGVGKRWRGKEEKWICEVWRKSKLAERPSFSFFLSFFFFLHKRPKSEIFIITEIEKHNYHLTWVTTLCYSKRNKMT